MLTLELSEQQHQYLLKLLDQELKLNGLGSLLNAVDLYNLLMSAKQVEEKPKDEKVEEKTND